MMNPERWHIRSLRRFEDSEIALAVYLCLGGVFSLLYTAGAIWHTRLYSYILNHEIATDLMLILRVMLHIVLHAIILVFAWAPDMISHVIFGQQAFLDWLFAADILKGTA